MLAIADERIYPEQMTSPARREAGGAGRGALADVLIAASAVLLLAAPLLFTSSGFAVDFTNHLWLSWAQGEALAQAGHPSYFLNAPGVGVFYPWFAFYGGPLYSIVGGLSDLLGDRPTAAYVGVTTLAIAGSYGGMLWLGREFGLRGPAAHAPALAVVTSAYYVTNLYGRGAWTEFMASAVIAPLIASIVHLVRAPAWRPLPVLALVVCGVVFTGSHNLTLVWGTTVGLLAATVMWLALGAPRGLPLGRLCRLGGLALLCLAINAWYLLPDLSYARDVRIHLEVPAGGAEATFFDTPAVLFDPLREVPAQSTTPALYVQVPVWFLAWGLLAGVVLLWRRGGGGRLRRAWCGLVALIAIVLAMIVITPLWRVMPFPLDEIQFPYRLGSYVFYGVGALVIVAALALQRQASSRRRTRELSWLRLSLACVCAISVGLCAWQLWVPNPQVPEFAYRNRDEALASVNVLPRTWYDPGSYSDTQAPIVSVPAGRTLFITPSSVRGDRYAAWLQAPPGTAPIQTNVDAGGYLVHISGLRRVGRDKYGLAIVRREADGSGPVHVAIETTHSATIVLAWALSVAGCVAALAILAWLALSGRRRRRERAA